MYQMHPDLMLMIVKDHQEGLRRAAGDARLRRQVLQHHRQRLRRKR